jgi:hypothetical protein
MIFSDFHLNRVILELRYENGFLYWDNCGAALLEILKKFPEWKWERTSTELTILKEKERNIEVSFNIHNIRFIQDEVDNLSQFKKATSEITPIILEKIKINNFSRIGNRFIYNLKLDSIEQGKKLIQKSKFIEIATEKLHLFGNNPIKTAFTIYFENEALQYRIEVTSIERIESPKNIKINENFFPKYGLRVDVDIANITKIDAFDFNCEEFIQNNYKFLESNLIKFI